jgi:hypothetical protein
MTICENILFHFTNKKETLYKILKTNIYPRLCLESCFLDSTNKKWAILMVYFCDIPLSNITQHTQKYGNYAIGRKKNWAIGQGVRTQHDLALKLGKRDSEVSKWLTGRHSFTTKTIAKIETAIGERLIRLAD